MLKFRMSQLVLWKQKNKKQTFFAYSIQSLFFYFLFLWYIQSDATYKLVKRQFIYLDYTFLSCFLDENKCCCASVAFSIVIINTECHWKNVYNFTHEIDNKLNWNEAMVSHQFSSSYFRLTFILHYKKIFF